MSSMQHGREDMHRQGGPLQKRIHRLGVFVFINCSTNSLPGNRCLPGIRPLTKSSNSMELPSSDLSSVLPLLSSSSSSSSLLLSSSSLSSSSSSSLSETPPPKTSVPHASTHTFSLTKQKPNFELMKVNLYVDFN